MLGKLDPISWVVKHASGLQLPSPTLFLTIDVSCCPILSSDSYYYSTEQLVKTGLYRFGKGSECAVARGITATRPPSAKLHSAVNAPVIPASLFVTKISASLARHSRIPAAIRANRWVRRRVTTALRTGSDAARGLANGVLPGRGSHPWLLPPRGSSGLGSWLSLGTRRSHRFGDSIKSAVCSIPSRRRADASCCGD